MQKTLSSRLEALEREQGIGKSTVHLTLIGSDGELLELGDGTRCRTRPSNDRRGDINLCIRFVRPEPRTEATEATA